MHQSCENILRSHIHYRKRKSKLTLIRVDDIQDESSQRRGRSSTHMVFGIAQTINSAMFSINEAIAWAQRLCGSDGVQVVIGNANCFIDNGNNNSLTLYTRRGAVYTIHGPKLRYSQLAEHELPYRRGIYSDDRRK